MQQARAWPHRQPGLAPALLPRPKPSRWPCHHQRSGRPGAGGPRLSGDVGVQPAQWAPRLLPAFRVPLGEVPQLSVPQFPPGTLGSQYLWCEVVGNILGVDTRKAPGAVPAGAASVVWVLGAWEGAGLPGGRGGGMRS